MKEKEQLNRNELVTTIQKYSGETKKDIEKFMDYFLDVVMQEVSNGKKVNLQGFGSFESVERAARIGKDPRGIETIIEARKLPKFVAGAEFKRRVNDNGEKI